MGMRIEHGATLCCGVQFARCVYVFQGQRQEAGVCMCVCGGGRPPVGSWTMARQLALSVHGALFSKMASARGRHDVVRQYMARCSQQPWWRWWTRMVCSRQPARTYDMPEGVFELCPMMAGCLCNCTFSFLQPRGCFSSQNVSVATHGEAPVRRGALASPIT